MGSVCACVCLSVLVCEYVEELDVQDAEVERHAEPDGAEQPVVRPRRHLPQRLVLAQAAHVRVPFECHSPAQSYYVTYSISHHIYSILFLRVLPLCTPPTYEYGYEYAYDSTVLYRYNSPSARQSGAHALQALLSISFALRISSLRACGPLAGPPLCLSKQPGSLPRPIDFFPPQSPGARPPLASRRGP